ncbi:unnamed protein product [Rotaria sp. Silwood2]|nr:unnamed protein product [Rotaria sp. Silwood2]CAF4315041.1 unnamed protein product [Rotaria sp. Silwood2]
MDIYHVYEEFFNLNTRFKNLLMHSNVPIHINISTMSKSNFEWYYNNIILPNMHRINILRLSNPFTIARLSIVFETGGDSIKNFRRHTAKVARASPRHPPPHCGPCTIGIVFSQPWLISIFLQLETLILDNISAQSLNNIADHLIILPKLHSLTINDIGYIQNATLYYIRILRLPKLKYCKIKFESEADVELLPKSTDKFSPIECLVINNCFRFQSLNNLLSYLQQKLILHI